MASVSGVGPRVPAVVAASDDLFVTVSCARQRLPMDSLFHSEPFIRSLRFWLGDRELCTAAVAQNGDFSFELKK